MNPQISLFFSSVILLLGVVNVRAGEDTFVGTWNLKGNQDGQAVEVWLRVSQSPSGTMEIKRLARFRDRTDSSSAQWQALAIRRVDSHLLAEYRRPNGETILVLYSLNADDPRQIQESSWPAKTIRSQGKRSLEGFLGTGQSTAKWQRLLDKDAIEALRASPNDPVLTRIAIARALIWHDLIHRADDSGFVPQEGGEWRLNTIKHSDGHTYQVVHWSDIDDNSWTVYFEHGKVYEVLYEN